MVGIEPSRAHSRGRTASVFWRVVALLFASTLFAAACASDDDDVASDETTTTEATDDTETDDTVTDDDPLGPEDPASGEPVKVGLISPGSTASLDNEIEIDVAEAAVEWINTHRAGIGGRPIELVVCVDEGDPAKAEQCADEMAQEGVVAVLTGSHPQLDTVYARLDAGGVPLLAYGGSGAAAKDEDSAFVLGSSDFSTIELAVGTAEDAGADKVVGVIIDVPAALDGYENGNLERVLEGTGVKFDVVPVPIGTADMTLVLQPVVGDDVGVVHVLGNDTFCISAFNALEALGYEGEITANSQCISDATIEQVSGDTLEGIRVAAIAPIGEDNESTRLYEAVIEAFATADVDVSRTTGYSMFATVSAFDVATEGIEGDVTQESVVEAISTMEASELPSAGGLEFRCGADLNPANPAICMRGGLVTVLGADGQPSSYEVVGNDVG